MTIRALLLAAAAVVALSSCSALAQQPAPEQQRDDDTPTFSTDDASAPIVGQPAGAQTQAPADDSGMTPEERADAAAGKSTGAAAAPGKPGDKKGPSKAELAWRERYAAAVKDEASARQVAQEAELAETQLKNQLGSTRTVAERNNVAAQIEQQGEAIRQARQAASAARARLDAVRAEGSANKYSPSGGPAPRTASGAPNGDYYRQQVADAQAAYDDATRRVQLYTDRVSDARGRALQNGGSGDNFAQAKIQEDIDAANRELAKAQADQTAARTKLDAATEAAQRANVALPRPY